MKLTASNDRYHVHWTTHVERGRRAARWCHQTFEQGWRYDVDEPDLRYYSYHRFTFYKLYHAQWFMAKWAD